MNEIKKREKLLILGCSVGTEDALEYAKELGVYTIITDNIIPGENSLKRMADEYWMIDVADVDALESKCKEEEVSGIFAATSEFCLDKAKELCKRLNFPFYASDEGWAAARDKERFKRHCISCGLNVPRKYEVDASFIKTLPEDISWPVIVKPADSYGQIGLSICKDESKLREGIRFALNYSSSRKVIVEDYIEGEEMAAGYLLRDGKAFLINTVDLLEMPVNGRKNFTYIRYNSIWAEEFKNETSKVEKLFQKLGCRNGFIFMQAIRSKGTFYFLEMGYRLNGAGSWVIDEEIKGINIVKYLVNYALGNSLENEINVRDTKGSEYTVGGTYMLWARPGKVKLIDGVEKVTKMKGVHIILQNFKAEDIVPTDISMKQIAFYICLVAEDEEKMKRKIQDINKTLHLYDSEGKEMLLYFQDYKKCEKKG